VPPNFPDDFPEGALTPARPKSAAMKTTQVTAIVQQIVVA
jgi:hypothetical protein